LGLIGDDYHQWYGPVALPHLCAHYHTHGSGQRIGTLRCGQQCMHGMIVLEEVLAVTSFWTSETSPTGSARSQFCADAGGKMLYARTATAQDGRTASAGTSSSAAMIQQRTTVLYMGHTSNLTGFTACTESESSIRQHSCAKAIADTLYAVDFTGLRTPLLITNFALSEL
jgi:hypothetical protein